jgi:hypothetical protein
MSEDLIERAFAAWFRSGETDQPAKDSGVESHEGRDYVVLRNVRGTMAVYRVKNDGRLRRLRRWPSVLDWV